MKKRILIAAVVLVIIGTACNQKRFNHNLEATWTLSRYIYAGKDETVFQKDTMMNNYKLVIEANNTYLESWQSLVFQPDTLYVNDTLSYDTLTSMYNIKHEVIPFIDSIITPHSDNGRWDLLNSDADLQLLDDSANTVREYNILKLSSSQLNLQNGNYEIDLSK